ncbi:hypothetical protein [Vibrio sp. WXL103]|uniref:hypothetical protein n=1 Tax=Vibrio sp. WXL103 TaxID=3450710 RepID=UPI003EC7D087
MAHTPSVLHSKEIAQHNKMLSKSPASSFVQTKAWLWLIVLCDLAYLIGEIVLNTAMARVSSGLVTSSHALEEVVVIGRTLSGIGLALLLTSLISKATQPLTTKLLQLLFFISLSVPLVHKAQSALVDHLVTDNLEQANLAHMLLDIREFGINYPDHFEQLKRLGLDTHPERKVAPETVTFLAYYPWARMGSSYEYQNKLRQWDNLQWLNKAKQAELEQRKEAMYLATHGFMRDVELNVVIHNLQRRFPSLNPIDAFEISAVAQTLTQAADDYFVQHYLPMQQQAAAQTQSLYLNHTSRRDEIAQLYQQYHHCSATGKLDTNDECQLKQLRDQLAQQLNWIFVGDWRKQNLFAGIRLFQLCQQIDGQRICPGDPNWDSRIALEYIEMRLGSSGTPSTIERQNGFAYGLSSAQQLLQYDAFYNVQLRETLHQQLGFQSSIDLSLYKHDAAGNLPIANIVAMHTQKARHLEPTHNQLAIIDKFEQAPRLWRWDELRTTDRTGIFSQTISTSQVLALEAIQSQLQYILGDFYLPLLDVNIDQTQFYTLLDNQRHAAAEHARSRYFYHSEFEPLIAQQSLTQIYTPFVAAMFSLSLCLGAALRLSRAPSRIRHLSTPPPNNKPIKPLRLGSILAIFALFFAIGVKQTYINALLNASAYSSNPVSKVALTWAVGAHTSIVHVGNWVLNESSWIRYDHPSLDGLHVYDD